MLHLQSLGIAGLLGGIAEAKLWLGWPGPRWNGCQRGGSYGGGAGDLPQVAPPAGDPYAFFQLDLF